MYKVKIYKVAQQDMRDIAEYLNTLSPQAAIKYYDKIVEGISSLANMPKRIPLVKDTTLRLRGYRTLIVGSYIVFFAVKGDTVEIRRILYGRRQYEVLL